MPKIDLRLLPLIETLVGSGADWLAFEILDGVRSGRPAEHSEEEVREAYEAVRSFRRNETPPPELKIRETAEEPLAGDEQIDFAARYVIDRISEAIAMENASLQQLNRIAIASQLNANSEAEEASPERSTSINTRLEGTDIFWNQYQAEEAISRLPELKKVLLEWGQSIRSNEQ